jgi:hypothetical protein
MKGKLVVVAMTAAALAFSAPAAVASQPPGQLGYEGQPGNQGGGGGGGGLLGYEGQPGNQGGN